MRERFNNPTGELYYSQSEILKAYDITIYHMDKLIKTNAIKNYRLCWSNYKGKRYYKYIIPASALAAIDIKKFPKRDDLICNPDNQPYWIEDLGNEGIYLYAEKPFAQAEDIDFNNPKMKYVNLEEWRKAPEYKELRRKCFIRDKGKCALCGSGINLEMHHLSYAHCTKPEEIDDVITLCRNCHTQLHAEDQQRKAEHEKKLREYYESIGA